MNGSCEYLANSLSPLSNLIMGTTYKELFKLYDLIQNGDARSVDHFLIDTSAPINVVIPCKGIGILHLAVGIEPLEKSRQCTELLLKHGGDPNLCNDDGISPVHIAAIWGRVENLKLLIGCGGDPSRRDFDGLSAFDYAAREQQWDVYDYLHNVVDQLDNSLESKCAYTLDLDKVLVTTDQIVAEYEHIADEHRHSALACRKSEMIRDWCDKNSLTMNKLYPTILGETYMIENESVPWKSINFTNNITLDLTTDRHSDKLNETVNSYKTCTSNKISDVKISGIQRLDVTSDDAEDCLCCDNYKKRRISVYENFSLPGSPSSITHKNYNSKSSLKELKGRSKSFDKNDTQSLITNDCYLDKALAVAQNKTNEWLSSSCEIDIKACNTRRSSASSGVSSTFSGGSIVLANVQEEYKYKDKEENVVLIEKRLLVSPIVLPVEETTEGSPDQTMHSVASLPTSVRYDDNTLRAELKRLGFTPGPISDNTRTLYLKKLQTLKNKSNLVGTHGKDGTHKHHDDSAVRARQQLAGAEARRSLDKASTLCLERLQALTITPNAARIQGKTYSYELEKCLRTGEWMTKLGAYIELENKARADFSNPNKEWREGKSKTSFTYLLLDPRLTNNLPAKAGQQSKLDSWVTFVNSIFYVGKGKRSRPYSHLYQALTLWNRDFTTSNDKKVQHILDIWKDKVGVVCLHIFQNVIPAEAYTYEAAMIDVIGISTLKNLKSGTYYGVAASWPQREKRMLGLYLLYKAMLIFFSEGERQLRPDDIE